MTVLASDLGTYLDRTDINTARAQQMIDLATTLALTIVDPLPAAADSVILDMVARAYTNVTSAHSVGLGSGQVSYGSPNTNAGIGGMYLSRANIAALRRMSGRSGAFSIDPTPSDAGTALPVWTTNVTYLEEIPGIEGPR